MPGGAALEPPPGPRPGRTRPTATRNRTVAAGRESPLAAPIEAAATCRKMNPMEWQAWITPALMIGLFGWLKADIHALRGEIHSVRERVGQLAEDVAFLKGALSRPPERAD